MHIRFNCKFYTAGVPATDKDFQYNTTDFFECCTYLLKCSHPMSLDNDISGLKFPSSADKNNQL